MSGIRGLQDVIYGVALIGIVIFMPYGAWGFVRKWTAPDKVSRLPSPSGHGRSSSSGGTGERPSLRRWAHQAVRGLTAVDGVDFAVEEGQILGLIGPNGAGKTTVFNLISRLLEPNAGSITFAGQNLLAVPPHRVVALGIARTFQNLGLFPYLSVLDNLLVGRHREFRKGVLPVALGLGGARSVRPGRKRRGSYAGSGWRPSPRCRRPSFPMEPRRRWNLCGP